jgi:CHAT domain-containing protein
MIDDLTINLVATEPPPAGHNVTLEHGGVTRFGAFRLAAVGEQIAQLQSELRKKAPIAETLKTAGAALFEELLRDDLRDAYVSARTLSATQTGRLRLRINSDQPALVAIPWEYLYDRRQEQWLALRPELSLVRGLPLVGREPQPVTGPLRVLVMVADPTDLPPLNSAGEVANLQAIEATGMIEVLLVEPTYGALLSALRQQNPHVFHFVGHGAFPNAESGRQAGVRHVRISAAGDDPAPATQGMLAFCRDDGAADLVEAERLAPLLADCASLGLVVLNACEGAVTGREPSLANNRPLPV